MEPCSEVFMGERTKGRKEWWWDCNVWDHFNIQMSPTPSPPPTLSSLCLPPHTHLWHLSKRLTTKLEKSEKETDKLGEKTKTKLFMHQKHRADAGCRMTSRHHDCFAKFCRQEMCRYLKRRLAVWGKSRGNAKSLHTLGGKLASKTNGK